MELLMNLLGFLGTAAFAISGVLVARENQMDVFGACLLGCTTACGGGVIRDLILGRTPPAMFVQPRDVTFALVVSLITFLSIYTAQRLGLGRLRGKAVADAALNVADSVGLGAFIIVGYRAAQYSGYERNGFLCVFVGVLTGIGGGILRDILAGHMPQIMQKHVYGLAAIAGGVCYWLLDRLGCAEVISITSCMTLTCLLRFLAIHYRWNLPRLR